MYTEQPQQEFREILVEISLFQEKNPNQPNLPNVPHYRFRPEDSHSWIMGTEFNGISFFPDRQDDRGLLYRTFIENDKFFLTIHYKYDKIYHILSISIDSTNSTAKLTANYNNTEIILLGYKGNFRDSIFSKSPLTDLNANIES